jgi:hypothetical protein
MDKHISISGTGKITISGYAIKLNEKNIRQVICEQLGVDPESYHDKEFYGRLSITIENYESGPVIENTMKEVESTEANEA